MTQEAGKSKEEIVGKHSPGALFSLETVYMWMEEYAQSGEQPWVRVEPGCKMPDYDDPVLWLCEDGNMCVEALDKDGNPWLFEIDDPHWGNIGSKATHWMPLPAPPKD